MSDQGYTASGGDSDVACCCQNCTPAQRKIGYYITFLIGLILFVLGIINSLGLLFMEETSALYLAGGGIIIILNPLWIKSCSKLLEDMKSPVRIVSSILFVGCIAMLIISKYVFNSKLLICIFSAGTALSGIWYFLSFFENGQAACVQCVKTCCCSKGDAPSGGEN